MNYKEPARKQLTSKVWLGSSVGIATCCQLDCTRVKFWWSEIYCTHPG